MIYITRNSASTSLHLLHLLHPIARHCIYCVKYTGFWGVENGSILVGFVCPDNENRQEIEQVLRMKGPDKW